MSSLLHAYPHSLSLMDLKRQILLLLDHWLNSVLNYGISPMLQEQKKKGDCEHLKYDPRSRLSMSKYIPQTCPITTWYLKSGVMLQLITKKRNNTVACTAVRYRRYTWIYSLGDFSIITSISVKMIRTVFILLILIEVEQFNTSHTPAHTQYTTLWNNCYVST